MFLLNMAFISSSEVKNMYISFVAKRHIQQKPFEFSFYYIKPYQQRGTCTLQFFQAIPISGFVPLTMNMRAC